MRAILVGAGVGGVVFVALSVAAPSLGAGGAIWALIFGALYGGYEAAQRADDRALAGRFVAVAAAVCAVGIIAAGVLCGLGAC